MNNICTSVEQSKKLLELGIDVNTADMYYHYYKSFSPSNGITKGHRDIPVIGSWKEHHISIPDPTMLNADIPAWSLNALLDLMPNVININGINYRQQEFKTENGYCYCYADENFPISFHGQPINAVFEMVCWLKENKKI